MDFEEREAEAQVSETPSFLWKLQRVCGVKRKVGWDVWRSFAVSFALIALIIIIVII